jgi:predicted nucleotidyltransferase
MLKVIDTYLEKVKAIVVEALSQYPVDIYLFGSHSREDAHALSDIDIAIDPKGSLPIGVLARLREVLEESTIPHRVEIVDLRDADPDFCDRIRKEGVVWNASTNG